jgi:hypothetical protein
LPKCLTAAPCAVSHKTIIPGSWRDRPAAPGSRRQFAFPADQSRRPAGRSRAAAQSSRGFTGRSVYPPVSPGVRRPGLVSGPDS